MRVVLRGCGKLRGSTSCEAQFSTYSQPDKNLYVCVSMLTADRRQWKELSAVISRDMDWTGSKKEYIHLYTAVSQVSTISYNTGHCPALVPAREINPKAGTNWLLTEWKTLTLIDNEAAFRQIIASDGLLVGTKHVEKLRRVFPQTFYTCLVAKIKSCHLAGHLCNNRHTTTSQREMFIKWPVASPHQGYLRLFQTAWAMSNCLWNPMHYRHIRICHFWSNLPTMAFYYHQGSQLSCLQKFQNFSRTFQDPQNVTYSVYKEWQHNLSQNVHHKLQRNCSVSTQHEYFIQLFIHGVLYIKGMLVKSNHTFQDFTQP